MAKQLLIDIGNSTIKWAFYQVGQNIEMTRQAYLSESGEAFFTGLWSSSDKPSFIFVTSVGHDDLVTALENAVRSLWGIKIKRLVSQGKGYGLINAYDEPQSLGSDRWCAMIGAYHQSKSAVVVVDCGSAITVDIVNQTGQHLGGYILPGLTMMQESLGNKTALVKVDKRHNSQSLVPGTNTTACVESATKLAAVSFIESVIRRQEKDLEDITCVLTGGDAALIAEHLTADYVIIPDTVLQGLAYIANHSETE